MENQIFHSSQTTYKSLVVRETELWLSAKDISNLEKFEKEVNNTGIMRSAHIIPLSSIFEVSFSDAEDGVKMRYKNEKGNDKSENFNFGDKATSTQFGNFLGSKLGLTKNEKQESQVKQLLLNALYIVIAVVATWWLASMDDTHELVEGSSRRSRSKGAFLKMIVDTIGTTGVIIVGSLVTLYLAYTLYKRYQNPATEVVYNK